MNRAQKLIAAAGVTLPIVGMLLFLDHHTPPVQAQAAAVVRFTSQSANTVLAGPTSGGASAVAFRTLVAGDIPSLSGSYLPIGGGTLTGNLLFTDAMFDIGASGATRPRNIFLSGNSTVGGAQSAATYSTATNCASGASPAVCAAAAAGAVAIPTGVTTVTLQVNTTAVTANSRIHLMSDDTLTIGGVTCNSTLATLVGGLVVTARTAGASFTITYNGTIATNPLCVSYSIIN